jgi:hypothetical protein
VTGKISQKFQFLISFSGLQGAVAFVIAVTQFNNQDFPNFADPSDPTTSESDCILTTTLFIAFITVFTMGGPIGTYFVVNL